MVRSVGAIGLALVAWVGCAAVADLGGAVDDFGILTISNDWVDIDDPSHQFTLESNDNGKRAGAVTGFEFFGITEFELTGSWAEGVLTLNVQRTPAVVYTSNFGSEDDPMELTLSGSDGSTVTVRRVVEP